MPLLKWLKWPKVAAGEWLLCRGSEKRKSEREKMRERGGAVGRFNLEGGGLLVMQLSGSSDFHAIRIRI